ncbi:hypothetical protein AYI68_g2404 [Smittium mucronatum]|uniref:Uncharacterized protein n=1 Tax=Smittium mucronatum TaxID=133383 RepID=A0A1R0H2R9_9FUNG|nr:hypothetical protein AYI68_g2404 [Smittium mucronatum]
MKLSLLLLASSASAFVIPFIGKSSDVAKRATKVKTTTAAVVAPSAKVPAPNGPDPVGEGNLFGSSWMWGASFW